MGDVPERAMFSQPRLKNALVPYMELTNVIFLQSKVCPYDVHRLFVLEIYLNLMQSWKAMRIFLNKTKPNHLSCGKVF